MNLPVLAPPSPDRPLRIAQARRRWIEGDDHAAGGQVESWLARSWQRCLMAGHRPQERVIFDPVSPGAIRHAADQSRELLLAARPVLDRLTRAIANTRYFAILTDAQGVVIDVGAPPDRSERAAFDIARVGVDLSERAVGTTAISTALAEQAPVWLHRGEHFFEDTSVYSCAGVPLFGPAGDCIGMLDLSGVNVEERPELVHLAAQSARSIENALVRRQPHQLLLRLNWPGLTGSEDTDGLLCLDADGRVTAANAAARQMLHQPLTHPHAPIHGGDLFALPLSMLWDAAQRGSTPIEVPLWSGLRLQCWAQRPDAAALPVRASGSDRTRLRDVEAALIRKAVTEARGNVAEAARALGISRATVYRKLGAKRQR